MNGPAADDHDARLRLTRRLIRLFRAERTGRLDRRPPATARRLIARRGALVDALMAAAVPGGAAPRPRSSMFDEALRELAIEVGRCRAPAERRRAALVAELRLRRGDAPASGLRGGGGRLLGSG